MENVTLSYVDDYLKSLLDFENEQLKEMRNYAEDLKIPIVHKEVANLLRFLVQMKKPKRVLELGMAISYSALLMLNTADSIEELHTFERNQWMYDRAMPFINKSEFKDKINIHFEDAIDGINNISGKYDFVFIDAVKSKYPIFWDAIIPHVSKNGLIVCDNVLYRGMICNDELVVKRDRTIVRSMRKFLTKIQNDPNCNTTILPIGEGVSISEIY
jgi:predicted O-methyltransferase YrrM